MYKATLCLVSKGLLARRLSLFTLAVICSKPSDVLKIIMKIDTFNALYQTLRRRKKV